MLAYWRSSTFGGAPNNVDTILLIMGLLFLVISTILWMMFLSPWQNFDDWSTPLYTGHNEHHGDDHAAPSEYSTAHDIDPHHPVVAVNDAAEVHHAVNPNPSVSALAASLTEVAPAAVGSGSVQAAPVAVVEDHVNTSHSASPSAPDALLQPSTAAIHAALASDQKPHVHAEPEVPTPPVAQSVVVAEVAEKAAATFEAAVAPSADVVKASIGAAVEAAEAAPADDAADENASDVQQHRLPMSVEARPDDLRLIEGIGPKIAEALNKAGILTFAQVAAMAPAELEHIVRSAGVRMIGKGETWPQQAQLAAEGKFEELKAFQDQLSGGRQK
jgi:predicted flap endonuclease-1-like 5' DNA nuclease